MTQALHGLRLFISYARGGRAHSVARSLRLALSEQGAEAFLDEAGLQPASTALSGQLARAIEQAHALMFLLGDTTHKCDWQEREARYAQDHAVPVLVVQTSPVQPPVYVYDAVPLPALGKLPEWLPALVAALQREAKLAAPVPLASSEPQAPTALDQAVHRYLADLLAGELADRATRYTPLTGRQCEQHSPLKGRRGLRFATTVVARSPDAPGEERTFTDALEAFRALPQAKQPRLAVLGEPGAGKSFTLERLFCEWAEAVLRPASAPAVGPVPLLVRLGDWTRSGESLEDFLTDQLRQQGAPEALAHGWRTLRDARRAVLLLDAFNEIPVGQRLHKAPQVQKLAEDARWAAVLISCRERDFTQTLALPFDTLTLQPLKPAQVLDYLYRWELVNCDEATAQQRAQQQFWQLAAGADADDARAVWQEWHEAGASFEQFWEAEKPPEGSGIPWYSSEQLRQHLRKNSRSLLRLASSPFWLAMLVERELLSAQGLTRLNLVDEFLKAAYADGERLCTKRNALDELPEFSTWRQALVELALALQHGAASAASAAEDEAGAQTRLPREQAPASLTPQWLEFSISVQVVKESSGQLHFSHQLLQEAMAAQAMLDAALGGWPEATRFWPASHWWQRNGWEVVAEMVGESLTDDAPAAQELVAWLAEAQPEVALRAWQAAGAPALPPELREHLRRIWLPGMTDPAIWPRPEARAAIGRAMAGFNLDNRPGVGLRADGLPDIEWVAFNDGRPFVYQGQKKHPGLPPFALARYPVTHRQFQAFVEADDGYRHTRWWQGFENQQREAPWDALWPDANCPRENVSWFEAVAFCRWLTHRLGLPAGQVVRLPTEREWERAARGRTGWWYPSSARSYVVGHANCKESSEGTHLRRTSAVGLYPQGATPEGSLQDMAGNVWEWCADAHDPEDAKKGEFAEVGRVLRGGSWSSGPAYLCAAWRYRPANWDLSLGFRVCRASPI